MIETFDQTGWVQQNAPEGFVCPLLYPFPSDLKNFEWAYYRLKNTDDFYTLRCFGILYGTINENF